MRRKGLPSANMTGAPWGVCRGPERTGSTWAGSAGKSLSSSCGMQSMSCAAACPAGQRWPAFHHRPPNWFPERGGACQASPGHVEHCEEAAESSWPSCCPPSKEVAAGERSVRTETCHKLENICDWGGRYLFKHAVQLVDDCPCGSRVQEGLLRTVQLVGQVVHYVVGRRVQISNVGRHQAFNRYRHTSQQPKIQYFQENSSPASNTSNY